MSAVRYRGLAAPVPDRADAFILVYLIPRKKSNSDDETIWLSPRKGCGRRLVGGRLKRENSVDEAGASPVKKDKGRACTRHIQPFFKAFG